MRHGSGGSGAFGRQGGGFGGGFGGGDEGFSRGRKFSSDDLQLLLMAMLVDGPRHGYELIKMLETRSNGFYTPSPGMVYPALNFLEELRLASVAVAGNRKCYSLTTEGQTFLESNRERIDVILAKLNFLAKKMGLVRRALAGERGAQMDEEEALSRRPRSELMSAFLKIKTLLLECREASAEQQLHMAAVLERAAADLAALAEAEPKET
jgi:DNA-binding PadR family transcriptional regulator